MVPHLQLHQPVMDRYPLPRRPPNTPIHPLVQQGFRQLHQALSTLTTVLLELLPRQVLDRFQPHQLGATKLLSFILPERSYPL